MDQWDEKHRLSLLCSLWLLAYAKVRSGEDSYLRTESPVNFLFWFLGLHSALLRLLATNYPHLCIVDDWICEEEITGTDALLRRMLLTSNAKTHSPKQLQEGTVAAPSPSHYCCTEGLGWLESCIVSRCLVVLLTISLLCWKFSWHVSSIFVYCVISLKRFRKFPNWLEINTVEQGSVLDING